MADTYRQKINLSGQFNTLQKGTLIGALDLVAGAVSPQAAPTIDSTPADAAAVATDLQSVVDALVAAGIFTA